MGLDMYLKAKTYVDKHDWNQRFGEKRSITDKYKQLAKLFPELHNEEIYGFEIARTIGYWRKANAIHNWFVKNVQNNVDECQESYVTRMQLQELLDDVTLVINDHTKAKELLPNVTGFFFGSQEYDDWYYSDLEHTKTMLKNLLDNPVFEGYDFYYQASW